MSICIGTSCAGHFTDVRGPEGVKLEIGWNRKSDIAAVVRRKSGGEPLMFIVPCDEVDDQVMCVVPGAARAAIVPSDARVWRSHGMRITSRETVSGINIAGALRAVEASEEPAEHVAACWEAALAVLREKMDLGETISFYHI